MLTDYRRFAGTVGTVMSLCCGAQCFVAHTALLSVSGRVSSGPSERTCGLKSGRRQGALRMTAEREPLSVTACFHACATRKLVLLAFEGRSPAKHET